MQAKIISVLALLAASSSVAASPIAGLSGETALAVRQEAEAAEISVEDIIEVAEAVIDLIKGISDLVHQHDIESQYTQSAVGKLAAQYPSKNVMVYGDSSSGNTFVNPVCAQQNCDIGLGFSKSYNLCVFDSGSFDRHGDGGYVNWAFEGNYNRDGSSSHVDFFPIGSSTSSKKRAAPSALPQITYDFTAQPGKNHTHIPLHAPVTYTPLVMPAPMLPPSTPASSKPVDDGNYLLSCASGNGSTALGVAYYKSVIPHGGNKGQQPDDFTLLVETTPKAASGNSTVQHKDWRFPVGAMEFQDTQTTFHWSIFGNSVSDNITVGETAGMANNGKEFFWMFKDETKGLFTKDSWTCDSLYYAL